MGKRSAVTAGFFGDGAVDEGEFHETLNLAELWRLPILFVCENNGDAMGMALERAEAETDFVRKARATGSRARRSTGWTWSPRSAGSSGTPALRSIRPFCISIVQRTASTTLRNSMIVPSPVRLTVRP